MNTIEIKELNEGDLFESPLLLNKNLSLLAPDIPVSLSLIESLKKWGFPRIFTEGSSLPFEAKQTINLPITTLDQQIKEKEGLQRAADFYRQATSFTQKTLMHLKEDSVLNIPIISEEIKKIIQKIKADQKFLLRFQDIKFDSGIDYNITHSVQTMILALSLGEHLKMPNHKLIELGITSLLHEVGMLKIPSQVYEKTEKLSENEKKLINAHTILGFRTLKEYSLAHDILLGVLEHHEREDGSGYPQNLEGDKISKFGKILAVACSYTAQISNRPFREKQDGHTSLTNMLKVMRSHYDESVMKALLELLSIYPLGSYVRLENGFIGTVIETEKNDFKHPRVKLLFDQNEEIFSEHTIIDTGSKEELFVKSVLQKKEIDTLYQNKE